MKTYSISILCIRSWDPSLLEYLPQHKLALAGICSTVEDIAEESSKIHDQEFFALFKDLVVNFHHSILIILLAKNSICMLSCHTTTFKVSLTPAFHSSGFALPVPVL